MNNKKKIVGIVLVCIFATILGVWVQHNRKDEEVIIVSEPAGTVDVSSPTPTSTPVVEKTSVEQSTPLKSVMVHVCGSVNNPGVYELKSDTRVTDAIDMAGGFSEDADEDYLNLADFVMDGAKIYVPSVEETKMQETVPGISLSAKTNDSQSAGQVNINTATKEELMSLTGVGESKADAIIEYRNNNGEFKSIEDIMNIRGIKEGLFNKIKDKIRV